MVKTEEKNRNRQKQEWRGGDWGHYNLYSALQSSVIEKVVKVLSYQSVAMFQQSSLDVRCHNDIKGQAKRQQQIKTEGPKVV